MSLHYLSFMQITQNNNTFTVIIENKQFAVTIDPNYLSQYERIPLLKASFKFLLDREPLSAILKTFNLKIINNYFPEYEKTIQNYFPTD